MEPLQFALVVPWIIAAGLALRFSLGNARPWSSLAIGFLLIPVSELLPAAFSPGHGSYHSYVPALGHLIGIAAILTMHHSVQDYYTFTQTLEERESRPPLSPALAVAFGAALLLLLLGPEPTVAVRRAVHSVENTAWLFLALINVGLIRRIRRNLGDTPVSRGFFAVAAVFACIALWKGCELYLDVYQLETFSGNLSIRYLIFWCGGLAGNFLAGIGAGATFLYLARLLR